MLLKLEADPRDVYLASCSRKGCWRMSMNSIVQGELTNEWRTNKASPICKPDGSPIITRARRRRRSKYRRNLKRNGNQIGTARVRIHTRGVGLGANYSRYPIGFGPLSRLLHRLSHLGHGHRHESRVEEWSSGGLHQTIKILFFCEAWHFTMLINLNAPRHRQTLWPV